MQVLSRWSILAAAVLIAPMARADDLTPFRIGISAPVVTIFPVWMAQAAGLDAKEGLKVESISMEGGSRGVQVLLSGEIQAMHVGLAPVVQANKQGADLRLVTSTANTIPITIFASPAIKTAADLKGKTIGISTFGSETDVAVSIALQRLGLKRDDVTVSQIGGSSQRFGALIAGRIDAAPLLEPTITAAKEKGFTPLLDLAAANTPWIFDGVVVTNGYLKEHRDALTHFVRAYIAGAYLALSDVDKAKALITQKYKTNDPTVGGQTGRQQYLSRQAQIISRERTDGGHLIDFGVDQTRGFGGTGTGRVRPSRDQEDLRPMGHQPKFFRQCPQAAWTDHRSLAC